MLSNRSAKAVLWVARIWGTLNLIFLLYFICAHLFGNDESGEGFRNISDIIAFAFYPVGLIVGLLLSYKWELTGGLITLLSMLVFFGLLSQAKPNPFMLALSAPAVFYLIGGYLRRSRKAAITG